VSFEITNITNRPKSESSILIIYTGGTFGMVRDESGTLIPFNFTGVLEKIPELKTVDVNLAYTAFAKPVDSSNINFGHWKDIAQIIYTNYNLYSGFVVLHGTDTMAYSASALSFMFDGLNKPVILTGAQIPIGAIRSDARENLITTIEIASMRENSIPLITEVCIYFNYVLLRGNRAQKIRSSTFSAFESENYPHLAESGIVIKYFKENIKKFNSSDSLSIKNIFNPNVIVLKIFPGMTNDALTAILNTKNIKGVVLESFGSGNTMSSDWFINSLNQAIRRGIIILNVSQCSGGGVIQGKYSTSEKLFQIGVISGKDITTEAALTKMMFLFGNTTSLDEVRAKLIKPLRGEMTL
jgi:L-asparaginase